MQFLSDFGDEALILPLAAAVTMALALGGARRTAWEWTLCVGGVLGAVLALKLLFRACLLGAGTVHSPSGHTAATTMVYGGLMVLLCRTLRWPWAWGLVGGGLVGVVIAVTRLGLGVHTPAEVVAGGVVGLMGLATFAHRARWSEPVRWPLPAVVALVVCVTHGNHLRAETLIDTTACGARAFIAP